MHRFVLAASIAALLAPAGWAQDQGPGSGDAKGRLRLPPSILLARSWDEAVQEATVRNVPIIFTTNLAT